MCKYKHYLYNVDTGGSENQFCSARILLKCLVKSYSQSSVTGESVITLIRNNGSPTSTTYDDHTEVTSLWRGHSNGQTYTYWQPVIVDLTPYLRDNILTGPGTQSTNVNGTNYKFRIKFHLAPGTAAGYMQIKHFAIMLDNTQPWYKNSSFIHQCTQGMIIGDILEYTTADMTATTSQRQSLLVAGNVGIGTSAPEHKLHVNNGSIYIQTTNDTGLTDQNYGLIVGTIAGQRLQIDQNEIGAFNGTASATLYLQVDMGKTEMRGECEALSFNATSDVRHKENICDLDRALEKICAIRGVNYTFKKDKDKNMHAGILAQEVADIIPEAICKTDDDKWSANYNTLIGYLIESVKTLKAENDAKDAQITILKTSGHNLENTVTHLNNTIENMTNDISAIKASLNM